MIVNRFTTLAELEGLRARWTELYRVDPDSNLFLSWDCLFAALSCEKGWMILGVRRAGSPYLAFLPLTLTGQPRLGLSFYRQLRLGAGLRADFTGMLGFPGEQANFIPALAREIERLEWDTLTLANCADRRIAALVAELDLSRYRVVPANSTPCPFATLPATWDAYLATRGAATRATLRKRLRRIERLPGYRVHFAKPDEAEGAIDGLLRLHSRRWKQSTKKWHRLFGEFLAKCYASGRFAVCALYQGTTLVAAQGFFIDAPQRRVVAYMIAHNPKYSRYSPGTMLMCASIRHAIESGFESYSFSLGAQPYKMSLATDVTYVTNAKLWRKNARASVGFRSIQLIAAAKVLARRVYHRSGLGRARARLLAEGTAGL
ncbi:MAG TPA: GNAT family N-acetyltransferase [Candidatus Cybelea sp.]|jgi:CelD/BcsL family acetyltransferase involved in cellulose biosynthesis|nr:GNAT family N-acetyltransferase [Candidatus Cybelea sp.]